MKYLTIEEEVYGCSMIMIFGKFDKHSFEEIIKTNGGIPGEFNFDKVDESYGICWDCGLHQVVWVIAEPQDSMVLLETLSHELVHAAFGMAAHIGFENHFDSQEFHCHIVQWAVRNFLNKDWEEKTKE